MFSLKCINIEILQVYAVKTMFEIFKGPKRFFELYMISAPRKYKWIPLHHFVDDSETTRNNINFYGNVGH